MQGETEERRRKKRKKKSKFGYYLYAVVILLLTIINITLATLLLTYVQSIRVSGNKNSQSSEVIAWIKEDPMTVNSLYTLWKFKSGSYTLPVYLEDVDVKLSAPWAIKVDVTEKQVIGCVMDGNAYVYFDAEGLVLQKSSQYEEGIPLIEGMEVKDTKQFKKIEVENEKVFSYIVEITKEIEKNQLSPDRIVWEEASMNLYFEQVRVQLGKSNFGEKVLELTALIGELEGRKGTLHLEHYTSESKNISFEKDAEEKIEENTKENY